MRHLASTLACSLLLMMLGACADGGGPGPTGRGPASLLIENNSQYVLDEVRIHAEPAYGDTPSMIPGKMQVGDLLVRHGSGSWWVTVIRPRYEGGPPVALTTETALELFDDNGYRLIVFDQSFRLASSPYITRESLDAGTLDSGPDDAGF